MTARYNLPSQATSTKGCLGYNEEEEQEKVKRPSQFLPHAPLTCYPSLIFPTYSRIACSDSILALQSESDSNPYVQSPSHMKFQSPCFWSQPWILTLSLNYASSRQLGLDNGVHQNYNEPRSKAMALERVSATPFSCQLSLPETKG